MTSQQPQKPIIIAVLSEPQSLSGKLSSLSVTPSGFADFFEEYCELWLKGILSEALNRWDIWLEGIGVILVAGGAAPLAQDWLDENSWFKVLPDPQFAHVLGLVA